MCTLYLTADEVLAQGESEKGIEGEVTLLSIYALLSLRGLVEVVVIDNPALTDKVNGELDYLCQLLS